MKIASLMCEAAFCTIVQNFALLWNFWKYFSPRKFRKITRFLYVVQVASQNIQGFFVFCIFNIKIWLNQLMDDHDLGYIKKLKKEKLLVWRPARILVVCIQRIGFIICDQGNNLPTKIDKYEHAKIWNY